MTATARAVRAGSQARGARLWASLLGVGLVAALTGPLAGVASAAPTPIRVPGNPSCPAGTFSYKLEGGDLHDYTNDPVTVDGLSGTLTLDIRNTAPGQVFDYTLTGELAASSVIVKGGPNANVYNYPTPETQDTGLHAPNRTANKYYGISHIDFCLVEAPQTGALRIRKTSTKGDNPLVGTAGATFTATGPGDTEFMVTDNGGNDENPTVGELCVSELPPGNYTVTEDTPPTGYGAGTAVPDNTGTVVAGTDCGDTPPSEANAVEFQNPPLADGHVTLEGRNDETTNRIVCVDEGGNVIGDSDWGNSVSVDLPALEPASDGGTATYTCTLEVDP
ncbi:hypothetical protein AB0I77_05485 [Streptomyces sp. NPDC050619]|uniref:SpaA isopeptide-forming pilin-related protein n=1 Tax=Streptomyces sp. NPDC050619 TaxID=3157214 RepID=UPI0034454AED